MGDNEEIVDAEQGVLARLGDVLLRDEGLAREIFGAPVSEVELFAEPGPLALRVVVGSVRWDVGVGRYPAN